MNETNAPSDGTWPTDPNRASGSEHPRPFPPPTGQAPGAHYPPYYASPYPYGYPAGIAPAYPGPAGPSAAGSSRRRRVLAGTGGAVVAAALVVAGVGIGRLTDSPAGTGTVAQGSVSAGQGTAGNGTGGFGGGSSGGFGGGAFPGGSSGGFGSGELPGGSAGSGFGSGSGAGASSGGTTSAATATSTQQSGIVTVVSVLKYQNAESAGTGMILTSDGEILTNNHVVNGATSITVTVESTGKVYRAAVVGTDPTDDVAVLQLRNASSLTTANLGDSSGVAKGDAVTGVGNAGGTGTLTQVSGRVTGLTKSITATDDNGSNAEHLTGLIETDANIQPGDSGGPLYNAAGKIVGIDTAASSSASGTTSDAYAIPIDSALKIASQIESGVETSSIHIGLPAFLGVEVVQANGGAGIGAVVRGGPADEAGITAGSVITAVGNTSVTSAKSLQSRLGGYQPGQRVSITWTDTSGTSHTATVTLVSGPTD